jgi:hypothetical protein
VERDHERIQGVGGKDGGERQEPDEQRTLVAFDRER